MLGYSVLQHPPKTYWEAGGKETTMSVIAVAFYGSFRLVIKMSPLTVETGVRIFLLGSATAFSIRLGDGLGGQLFEIRCLADN